MILIMCSSTILNHALLYKGLNSIFNIQNSSLIVSPILINNYIRCENILLHTVYHY